MLKCFCFFEIIDKVKKLRCKEALQLMYTIVGSSIGDPESDTHMDRSEVKIVWDLDLRKEKHERLSEHYRNMEEFEFYSFVEPSLYSQKSRIGPVGEECVKLWYINIFFCRSI